MLHCPIITVPLRVNVFLALEAFFLVCTRSLLYHSSQMMWKSRPEYLYL